MFFLDSLPKDPRQWGNTAFWPAFSFFLIYGWMLAAIIGDYYTTVRGLAKGLVEANPLNRWLFKKIGQPLTVWLEAVAATAVACVFGAHGLLYGSVYMAIVAAGESAIVLRNYLKLKKAK